MCRSKKKSNCGQGGNKGIKIAAVDKHDEEKVRNQEQDVGTSQVARAQ